MRERKREGEREGRNWLQKNRQQKKGEEEKEHNNSEHIFEQLNKTKKNNRNYWLVEMAQGKHLK